MADRSSDAKPGAAAASGEDPGPGTHQPKTGGFKSWLPLLVTMVAMPALAYATTTFIIVPQISRAVGHSPPAAPSSGASGHAPATPAHGAAKDKQSVALSKLIVNVAGTMGTRYLLTSITLVGGSSDFKSRVEEHRDQLLDLATSTLSNKTIAELETAGARNQIRSELITGFNTVLGDGAVREIFITEFAIQ